MLTHCHDNKYEGIFRLLVTTYALIIFIIHIDNGHCKMTEMLTIFVKIKTSEIEKLT